MGFYDRRDKSLETEDKPNPYAGAKGMATYAGGMVMQDGQSVLPAESAVSCTRDPSIRDMYNRSPMYCPHAWVGKTLD